MIKKKTGAAKKSLAVFLAATLFLSGCQENTVVENGDLPQSIEAQNDLTQTTTEAETTTTPKTTTTKKTTTTTKATTTTTTTSATTTAETTSATAATASAAPGTAAPSTNANTAAATAAPSNQTAAAVTTTRVHISGYRGGTDYPAFKHDIKYMADMNTDFIGWLQIKDTPIDLPIVQATDNKFYLEHDFYGRYDYTKVGTSFADYHIPVTEDGGPQNLIIYGHNIRTGVGLAKITNYYPARYGSLDFYLTHPTISYESVYGGESTYVVFAGMFVNTQKQHGAVFNYHRFRSFDTKDIFYQYFEAVMDRSVFYNPALDISYDDEFLTLSTCYFPLGNIETRFVLFARKLRSGESASIDVSKAYTNRSPLYFDYYYAVNGGSWAGRNWSTSLIDGYADWVKSQQETAS
ncbi:MAG: class B sortase [Bacteroides sp.]|nr:class B sortase [Eubacterium sp.]MCM1419590.1 class B sortase [Roseburia sp.]MCM1463543.1 class B sortase [Bacteroides sp.]